MIQYYLMHQNDICGTLVFDEINGRVVSYKDNKTGLAPYLGNANINNIKKWWEMRAVPSSRSAIQTLLRKTGCLNTEMYLAKNLALSMTDAYWVCPADTHLSYEQVKFSNLRIYNNEGKVPYHNDSSYDYNASLGGQLEKYWDLEQTIPDLVKECTKYYGQQSINEVVATRIHILQQAKVPFVKYTAEKTLEHGIISHCAAFTSDNAELISAYEIVESQKPRNDISLYDHYIETCVKNGIDREIIQNFMDYQTLTDFIISNTDEHLNNFGVLRNPKTMKLIGPAPIYDSGNSMFYNNEQIIPLSRSNILDIPISSFYNREEKMLSKIQNKNIVKLDLLPAPNELKEWYTDAGIPDNKAEFISKNYETKLEMAYEFQQGKKISLYAEQRKEKQKKQNRLNAMNNSQKFVVLCGLPGSGKTILANKLLQKELDSGKEAFDINLLYSVKDAVKDSSFILDKNRILNNGIITGKYSGKVSIVSANNIRNEILKCGLKPNNNLTFLIAEIRMSKALKMGADVIFDASNLIKENRQKYINMARKANIRNIELYITDPNCFKSTKDINDYDMNILREQFSHNYPSKDEGWDNIYECKNLEKDLYKEKLNSEHEELEL